MCDHITIRSAVSSDLDRVAAVWHDSALHMDGAALPIPSCAELRHRINFELANGWKLFVAERNYAIVGLLAIKPQDEILDQLFVLGHEQLAGIGSLMLAKAQQEMPNGFRLRMAKAMPARPPFTKNRVFF